MFLNKLIKRQVFPVGHLVVEITWLCFHARMLARRFCGVSLETPSFRLAIGQT